MGKSTGVIRSIEKSGNRYTGFVKSYNDNRRYKFEVIGEFKVGDRVAFTSSEVERKLIAKNLSKI